MGHARRWASVALVGLVAACLSTVVPGPARADEEVLGWKISGGVEAGGIYPWGNRSSAQWEKYRDMTSGFLGELNILGEKKDSPWFFELGILNPGRTDQLYEGAVGRYGLFRFEGGWNQTPVVFSNSAYTIFTPVSGDTFVINPAVRGALVSAYGATPLSPLATPPGLTPAVRNNITAIQNTLTLLAQPVSLRYSANVGNAGLKVTPTENLRFDIDWLNIYNQGNVPLGTVIGSPGGAVTEFAIPISNQTNQFTVGAEYAKANWGLQFNYIGSFFSNYYNGYTWQNPTTNCGTVGINPGDAPCASGTAGGDRLSAPPDNTSNTFNLTGTVALPLRTRINGTFGATLLRQNQTFDYNTAMIGVPVAGVYNRTNIDDSGMSSADAKVNQYLANIVLTSRPFDTVNVTARYRYFDYQNNTPSHTFSTIYPEGINSPEEAGELTSAKEGYARQNFGFDVGWRPIRDLSLKAGAAYVNTRWSQAADQNFSNGQYLIPVSADWNPTDWFLGRVSYLYQNQSIGGYTQETPANGLPNFIPYNYAPNNGNRIDALLQFPIWESLTPSISAGYSNTGYNQNQYGLRSTNYWTLGANLDWSPTKWLTIGGDVSYEQYNYQMASAYSTSFPFPEFNKWNSTEQDQYYNFGINATLTLIPKKFIITGGYNASLGYTTIQTGNPAFVPTFVGPVPATATAINATAFTWNQVRNIFQTARVVAKFYVTEKLSVRGGFAWEGYSEKDFARDPMQQFMGFYENVPASPVLQPPFGYTSSLSSAGIQSVYLGATVPGYNAYVVSGYVRYDF